MTHLSLTRGSLWLALLPLLGCGTSSPDGGAAASDTPPTSQALPLTSSAELLRDVNARPSPFPPILSGSVPLANGTTLLVIEDSLTGAELWRSDGTVAGTSLLQDLTPGVLSFSEGTTNVTAAGNTAFFFSARSYLGRTGLWKTDGTTPGTVLLQEFEGDDDDYDERRGNIVPFGSGAVFTFGNALWKTDGTAAGTRELKRFPPVRFYDHEFNGVSAGVALSSVVLFLGNDPTTGMELWRTNGTPEGTVPVKDLIPGTESSTIVRYARLGSNTLFVTGGSQDQLWRSNGTPQGTVLVHTSESFIDTLVTAGSNVFFATGQALWKTNGTPLGTVEVRPFSSWAPYRLAPLGNRVFFVANDEAGHEPWVSDGTPLGTSRVADLWPGAGDSQASNFFAWKGRLYFQATPRAGVLGLYKTDGTSVGTVELKTWDGYADEYPFSRLDPVSLENLLAFHVEPPAGGVELWRTDGTVAGTRLLEPLRPGTTQTSQASLLNLGILDGYVFFLASEDGGDLSLWKSDGTPTGTSRVKTFANTEVERFAESAPGQRVGTSLYFALKDGTHGEELWRTDGTEAGTVRVKDIAPGEEGSDPSNLVELGGALLFTTGDYDPMRLWKSDGTEAGTVQVVPEGPEVPLTEAHGFTKLGARVLFAAKDAQERDVLWTTDGTPTGTQALKTFEADDGFSSTWVDEVTSAGGLVYFSVTEFTDAPMAAPVHLWKSDGTAAGTVRVSPQAFRSIEQLAWVNGHLYFSGEDETHGAELWVSDGTAAGTRMLVDLNPGAGSSHPGQFAKVGTAVFFAATDGSHGFEPWVTNGTSQGTTPLADIWPGAESGVRYFSDEGTSFITPLALEDRGLVLFVAAEPGGGAELWRTDGTVAGTYRQVDALPGPLSADPSNIARLGDRLFFFAADETHGREPWGMPLDPAPVTARASGKAP
ncbi:hypothetical protein HPC49_02685 [Pyxidicoccus fallax]|uniref:Hyalin repeat protein n=1 Tax=Pyxidicoccus fallax TaxID=394095 RepID=A0A848L7Y9_9BACT|nr:hypothetical protein [Pyxidicoccus fallax]NPC77161.1 hypothetical protein [Pyxidicoccus fallax]